MDRKTIVYGKSPGGLKTSASASVCARAMRSRLSTPQERLSLRSGSRNHFWSV